VFYSPAFVRRWLLRYGDLCALAESASTARGLTRLGPTPETPRAGARQAGFSGDQLEWACVRADLVRAANLLIPSSIEARVVGGLMLCHTLGVVAGHEHVSYAAADAALNDASDHIAERLTGEPIALEGGTAQCGAAGCENQVPRHHSGSEPIYCSPLCRLRSWRAERETLMS